MPFPGREDEKWNAIKSLETNKQEATCDALYQIYLSIDTSIKGFGGYYDVIFNALIKIDTEKSAKTIGTIYAIRPPQILSQSTIISLSNLSAYELVFPGILNSLKSNLMNAHWVLKLLNKGIHEQKISTSQMISFLPTLELFYKYTKEVKISRPQDGLILDTYYWISNAELARSLQPIKANPTARKILTELFQEAKKAGSPEEKMLSWEAFKALDTTLQSGEYLEMLGKDIDYRKKIFTHFKNNDKLRELPESINNQQALSEMISVSPANLRRHDTNGPKNVYFAGMKEVNKEYYYFYRICWWEDCKSNSLVVVGPQPLDKTKFNENPRLSGESIGENVEADKIAAIIENFKIQ
jgi:hypothetical protein